MSDVGLAWINLSYQHRDLPNGRLTGPLAICASFEGAGCALSRSEILDQAGNLRRNASYPTLDQ
jgi:hypothetical protein